MGWEHNFHDRQHGTALVYHPFRGDRTTAATSFCMWSLNSVPSEKYRHSRWVELSKTCQQRSRSYITAISRRWQCHGKKVKHTSRFHENLTTVLRYQVHTHKAACRDSPVSRSREFVLTSPSFESFGTTQLFNNSYEASVTCKVFHNQEERLTKVRKRGHDTDADIWMRHLPSKAM